MRNSSLAISTQKMFKGHVELNKGSLMKLNVTHTSKVTFKIILYVIIISLLLLCGASTSIMSD